jgi:hypothetical protein
VEISGGYADNGIGYECFVPNVLNLGVSPSMLVDIAAQQFMSIGGVLREFTSLKLLYLNSLVSLLT